MRVLIVEDEARIARRLERMVKSIMAGELQSLELCSSLDEAQNYLSIKKIDLLFLDLNLNGEDGFEVLESMVSEPFHTIIVSAYKDRAVRAFEFGVLDFVPKPFDEERLAKAISRMSQRDVKPQTKYLAVQKRGRRILVNVEDILYIQGAGIYTELHLRNGRKEVHNKSLESLNILLPDRFERIHKSYIADMTAAKSILVEPGSKYRLMIENELSLPIGRTRYKQLKEKYFA